MNLPQLLVTLEDIPPEGLDLDLKLEPGQLAPLVATEAETPPVLLSPLIGKLHLTRTKTWLSLQGDFQVEVEIPCDRCLVPSPVVLIGEVTEKLELVAPGQKAEGDEELDGTLEVKGGQVNLSGLMAEMFWLAWPFRHICRPDCAGICPRCGADLNVGPCGCPK